VVDDPTTTYRQRKPLSARKVVCGRSYAPFNPACPQAQQLFKALLIKALLNGNHLIQGFRNADIRVLLFRRTTTGQQDGPCHPTPPPKLEDFTVAQTSARARLDCEGATEPPLAHDPGRTAATRRCGYALPPRHARRAAPRSLIA